MRGVVLGIGAVARLSSCSPPLRSACKSLGCHSRGRPPLARGQKGYSCLHRGSGEAGRQGGAHTCL